MAINCFSCKWHRIKHADKAARQRLKVTDAEIEGHCADCLSAFKMAMDKKPRTCLDCEWKDRNLPYEARRLRCNACVEAFVKMGHHDCTACPWNDPRRRMPSVETLEHCKACIAAAEGAVAMNCENCGWKRMPEASRRLHCVKCSMKFAANGKVKNSINELSNKGQTIISYDNHNADMTDDRDTVSQIRSDYAASRKSGSSESNPHPIFHLADRVGMSIEEFAENAYENMKRFLFEFGQLSDMQALLFLSEVKGVKKTEFARNHNLSDSAVNVLYKQVLYRSPIFKDFIILSRGTIEGTRGRKSKDGKSMERVPKKIKKTVYLGTFQPSFNI